MSQFICLKIWFHISDLNISLFWVKAAHVHSIGILDDYYVFCPKPFCIKVLQGGIKEISELTSTYCSCKIGLS
jgi:hypothetical protein